MYCGHCMSTSPSLLAKLKIDLLISREINRNLKSQVESILEYGLGKVESNENKPPLSDSPDSETSHVEGEILGKRLLKLNLLRSKKKNNRIRYRVTQLVNRVNNKRRTVEFLKSELAKDLNPTPNAAEKLTETDPAQLAEKREQIHQIHKVLSSAQEAKLRSLREWFVVRKRDSYEFPYSLAFQPVVSLKNFYRLPPMVAWGSIIKMSQYMILMSDVLLYKLPCKLDVIPEFGGAKLQDSSRGVEDLYGDDNNVADCLTKLVINILQLSRHLNLLSKNPVDLTWLLDQHDLDTLFYCMITSTAITSRPVSHHWTFTGVLAVVSEALQLSIYAASPASRQTLAGTMANNSDRWFLVG